MYQEKSVCEVVREMTQADTHGIVKLSKYVEFVQRERIDTTFAYLNSKHLSGDTDHMGREKPFKQIIIPVRNVVYRATDIDRKNITIGPDSNAQVITSLLASIKLQQWMKKQNFGQYLNDWGLDLSNHNATISKFVDKGDELICKVMNWDKMIVDPIDFYANPQIEKIDFTPADLKKQKNYDQEMVAELLENLTTRKTNDGQDKDDNNNYITVYEVHGEFPLSYITDNEADEDTYVQQMHVVCFQAKDSEGKEYDEYTLYKGKEKVSPYEIDYLIKQEGVTYPGGVVQELEQAQWMTNHYEKLLKDKLDGQKDIYQTNDDSFLGKNATTDIENGDVLNYGIDKQPLTKINNEVNIVPLQSAGAGWMALANLIGGISEAMITTPKAGTAWRSLQAQLQEAHSLFELMKQNKGLALIKNLTRHVIPFFKRQLDNTDEIIGALESYQVKQIDSMYLPAETNRRMNQKKKDVILSGEIYTPEMEMADNEQVGQEVQGELQGNRRPIASIEGKTWKEIFSDLNWENLEIDVTGEGNDFEGNSETFKSILGFLANLQGRPMSPPEEMIFNKMLINTRIVSPLELSFTKQPNLQPQQTPAPVAQPALAG